MQELFAYWIREYEYNTVGDVIIKGNERKFTILFQNKQFK